MTFRTPGELAPDEEELLRVYRGMPEEERDRVLEAVKVLAGLK